MSRRFYLYKYQGRTDELVSSRVPVQYSNKTIFSDSTEPPFCHHDITSARKVGVSLNITNIIVYKVFGNYVLVQDSVFVAIRRPHLIRSSSPFLLR
jgi:hypothetical protein